MKTYEELAEEARIFEAVKAELERSDIVWPKYGSDTIDQLADRITRTLVD